MRENIVGRGAALLGSFAAFTFLGGCAQFKSTPVDLYAITPENSKSLLGCRIIVDGVVKYYGQEKSLSSGLASPIGMYPEKRHTDYIYDVTISTKSGDMTWRKIRVGDRVRSGPMKITAILDGVSSNGTVMLSSFGFLKSSKSQ